MNILLWVLQVVLAVHTAIGAIWKFSHNPAETMPTLKTIPVGVWTGMTVLELAASVCLILPALDKRFAVVTPVAGIFVAAEMLLFCGVHLSSGDKNFGPLAYWLVVAAIGGFIAFGRLALRSF